MKNQKITNIVTTGLDFIETGLTIAGAFVPLVGAIGGGIGIFNKIHAKKNFEYFVQKIESIEVKLNNLTEEQERNFSFRVIDVTNKVIKARRLDKIDCFIGVIKTGISFGTIIEGSEEIDKVIDIVDKLDIEDIEFLEKIYKMSIRELDVRIYFQSIKGDMFENSRYFGREYPEETNPYGFKNNSTTLLQRCVGYGLLTQSLDVNGIIDVVSNSHTRHLYAHTDSAYGFEYQPSHFYIKFREYILNKVD